MNEGVESLDAFDKLFPGLWPRSWVVNRDGDGHAIGRDTVPRDLECQVCEGLGCVPSELLNERFRYCGGWLGSNRVRGIGALVRRGITHAEWCPISRREALFRQCRTQNLWMAVPMRSARNLGANLAPTIQR